MCRAAPAGPRPPLYGARRRVRAGRCPGGRAGPALSLRPVTLLLMPPASRRSRRSRRYDPNRTGAAVRAQFAHVRDAVRTLTGEQLAAPVPGGWTVRELAVRLAEVPAEVGRVREAPEPRTKDTGPTDWALGPAARTLAVGAAAGEPDAGEADTREPAADLPDLPARYEEAAALLDRHLAAAPAERLVDTGAGAMTWPDFLVTVAVRLVVHTDDLARATGRDVPLDRGALAACTRLLADALAAKAPGASTEVRVPPYAVVQCVPGPRHTRGTPPSVVETDPLTWVRLATGRLAWDAALEDGRVSASGRRSDLGALLPLPG